MRSFICNKVIFFSSLTFFLLFVSCTKSHSLEFKIEQNTAICCKVQAASIQLKTEIITSGLVFPWGLAFLPDGTLLVTEKPGRLRIIENKMMSAPITGLPPITITGQGGLMDVVLDPHFSENNTIYLSFSQPDSSDSTLSGTAIMKGILTKENKLFTLKQVRIIFSASNKTNSSRHFGSRLAFAKDGTLFATLGERGDSKRAQDPFDHAGSVIRINSDGSIPNDNPFADGNKALPEIFSIGHRNAQGAAIHPISGNLWTLAHGPKGGDEINIIAAKKNYGWPVISYGLHYSNQKVGLGTHAEGYEQPAYYWDPSIAPSGLAFYNPDNAAIPEWKGNLLAGALKYKMLVRLVLEGNTIVREEHYLKNSLGRIRDVRVGIDGAIWLLSDEKNGKIIRLTKK